MAELPDLSPIPGGNVSDDDLLLIFDVQNSLAYKITRGQLLGNVARENADATFANLSAEEFTATQITPALLLFASGGGVGDMVSGSFAVTVPTIAAQEAASVNVSVPGAATSMLALVTISDGLAAGLSYTAHVSAAGTVTIRFVNGTANPITGASRTAKIALMALQE